MSAAMASTAPRLQRIEKATPKPYRFTFMLSVRAFFAGVRRPGAPPSLALLRPSGRVTRRLGKAIDRTSFVTGGYDGSHTVPAERAPRLGRSN